MYRGIMQHRVFLSAFYVLAAFLCLFPPSTHALTTEWQKAEFSAVRLIGGTVDTEQNTLELGVELSLDDGWKTYWRSPGDAGFPLTLTVNPDSTNISTAEIRWPYPKRFVEEWGLEVFGFKQNILIPVKVRLTNAAATTHAAFTLSYAVCSDICINEEQSVSIDIPERYSPNTVHVRQLAKALESVPQENGSGGMTIHQPEIRKETPNGGVLAIEASREDGHFRTPDLFIEGSAGLRFPQAETELSKDKQRITFLVPYEISLPAKTLAGTSIRATLVSAGKAVEASFTAGAAPAAVEPLATGGSLTESAGKRLDTPAAPASFSAMLLLALVGGVILNIMPCVLPVLSIKLLGVVKHGGGDTREVRTSFLMTVLGILTFFIGLAAITIAAKQAGQAVGWGFHFQSPEFLTFLVVLILLFAFNLLGWFEIVLPAWLNTHIYEASSTGKLRHRHHLLGDFMTGLFAALMATPCSAPFLGTAVGFALARGEMEILLIFIMLGLGLALPYLLAALFPAIATRLPKPGKWMLWVKYVMGTLLLAASTWLVWVIAGQVGMEIATGIVLLSLFLCFLLRKGRHWRWLRGRGMVALWVAVLVITVALLPNLHLHDKADSTSTAATEHAALWQPFDRSAIAKHVAQGKTVFVDVTADWCLTCKFNKLRVLDTEEVRQLLSADDVIAMRADITRPQPEIHAYLKEYGRYGIPFNIVYGPVRPEGIPLSELLDMGEVKEALGAVQE